MHVSNMTIFVYNMYCVYMIKLNKGLYYMYIFNYGRVRSNEYRQ